jgi:hypothetical protein
MSNPKMFSVKSNAARARKAFIDKHKRAGATLEVHAAEGGFMIRFSSTQAGRRAEVVTEAARAAGFDIAQEAQAPKAVAPNVMEDPAVAALFEGAPAEAKLEAVSPPAEPEPAPKKKRAAKAKAEPEPAKAEASNKSAIGVEMLQSADGATVPEIMERFGWQPHTTRGWISAHVGKKLGHKVTTEKVEGRGRVYRIAA